MVTWFDAGLLIVSDTEMSGVFGLLVRLDPETSETCVTTPHPDDLGARVLMKQSLPSRRLYDETIMQIVVQHEPLNAGFNAFNPATILLGSSSSKPQKKGILIGPRKEARGGLFLCGHRGWRRKVECGSELLTLLVWGRFGDWKGNNAVQENVFYETIKLFCWWTCQYLDIFPKFRQTVLFWNTSWPLWW